MADGVTFEIPPSERRRMQRLLAEMSEVTKKEMPKVIRNMGRDFVKSAVYYTPVAPKYRRDPYRLIVDRAGRRRWIPARPMWRTKIVGRFYAKVSWLKAARKLGLRAGIRGDVWSADKKNASRMTGIFNDALLRNQPYIDVGSRVDYIVELDRGSEVNPPYNITKNAIRSVLNLWEVRLSAMSKKLSQRWGR